ncbi:flagellar protein FlaG [Luminiphilus sp.]|nr:flagellar protein FlaG [Luminiphilus sp.]
MDKISVGEASQAAAIRQSNSAPVEQRERAPRPVANVSQSQASVPNTSVRSVAAEAEQEQLRSLATLQSVSESIDDAVEVLNQALTLRNTAASISRDEELNRYLITIKDKESGEVVREIPDEALIKFARNLQELRGILFDETT